MTINRPRLTFSAVDGLAFAASKGLAEIAEGLSAYVPDELGPLLEVWHLVSGFEIPKRLRASDVTGGGLAPLLGALCDERLEWTSPRNGDAGLIRTAGPGDIPEVRATSFLMSAKRAAKEVSGLPDATAGQLTAAIVELESNVREHSENPSTGLLAFRAIRGLFEFVVCDRGVGVLRSLQRCSTFSSLCDHGAALHSALTDGISRYGPGSNRGHGFRPIFVGLSNLHGALRFRSGDHALLIDGRSPDLPRARLAQKPYLQGFFVSVLCSDFHVSDTARTLKSECHSQF